MQPQHTWWLDTSESEFIGSWFACYGRKSVVFFSVHIIVLISASHIDENVLKILETSQCRICMKSNPRDHAEKKMTVSKNARWDPMIFLIDLLDSHCSLLFLRNFVMSFQSNFDIFPADSYNNVTIRVETIESVHIGWAPWDVAVIGRLQWSREASTKKNTALNRSLSSGLIVLKKRDGR